MAECLARRHQATPVHSLSEIQWLQSAFPTNIRCVVAKYSGEVVGGIVIFRSDRVDHGQYSACSPEGLALRAAPLLIDRCIAEAENAGVRYFDLGTSNECEGMVLNESLHKFKSDFGAGGVAYERYELPLN
ncbi:MAG: GNAT family N-acetyltransferase [Actinobacteria bacterium]|nr:GNAT family N-acetyltransferase [Actinomycetota bacterium]